MMKQFLMIAAVLCVLAMNTVEAKLPDFDARAKQAVEQSIRDAAAKQRKADYNLYHTAAAGSSATHPEAMGLYYDAMNRELRCEAERSMERSKSSGNIRNGAVTGGALDRAAQLQKEEEQRDLDRKAMMARIEALQLARYQAELAALEKRK
ncbi:MAG: hypothetical protein SPI25_04680 [Dialister sp.]|nr:hypothetical protein [Dialister sp.]